MEPGKTTRRPKLKVEGGTRGVTSRTSVAAKVKPSEGKLEKAASSKATSPKARSPKRAVPSVTNPKRAATKTTKAADATKPTKPTKPKASTPDKATRLSLTDRRRRLLEHMQGDTPNGAERGGKSGTKVGSAKSRGKTPIEKMALGIAQAGLEKKAQDVEMIDVRGKVDYADFVIVMSGRSDRQVAAIARFIDEEVKRQYGVRSLSMEGVPQGVWVLIDFGDIVVHVFHEETRQYYNLESFWMDAKRVRVSEPTRSVKSSVKGDGSPSAQRSDLAR